MSWQIVGLCLLHFLWQGALLGLVAGGLMAALRQSTAQIRYAVCCLAMLAMACCLPLTAWALSNQAMPLESPLMPPALVEALNLRLLVWVWLVGVGLLTIRMVGGVGGYFMLSRVGLSEAPPELLERFHELARTLGIRIRPHLYLSSRVMVPTAIGLIKGVVLLPVSVVCGVSPKMLEALLLHELAHISRFDFLANALQCMVEVVLFYHPSVWWLSKRIRQERENCCDDIVVRAFEDRKTYVRALAAAAELRPQTLALRSDGGDLPARMRRILSKPQTGARTSPILLGLVLVAFVVTPVLAGFKVAPPVMDTAIIQALDVDGGVKVYTLEVPEDGKVDLGGQGEPAVIDAVYPVEAVDRETALKNGWIGPND